MSGRDQANPPLTSGWLAGTSGWLGVSWRSWAVLLATTGLVMLVNATTDLMQADRLGRALDPRLPFLWEATSILAILLLVPGLAYAARTLSPVTLGWPAAVGGHVAGLILFSAAHVLLMVLLRKLALLAAGADYDFGPVLRGFVYEFRKDLLAYGAIVLLLLADRRLAAGRVAPPAPATAEPASLERIEIRAGERKLWLAPADILWLESAGNYVEIHTAERAHLVRGTLAGFEQRLKPAGFVRVHRARLVNATHLRAVATRPSGDFDITLAGNRVLAGSRRYRDQLPSQPG